MVRPTVTASGLPHIADIVDESPASTKVNPVTYDDGVIACTEDALVIRRYYFPLAKIGDKRIPYAKIRSVQRMPLTTWNRYRLWGSGDFIHWYNLDPSRPSKSERLVIGLSGGTVEPVITPDDVDRVSAELAAHGVDVTTG